MLLLLISSWVYGQDCKFEVNEIDAFSKNKKVKTKKQVVAVTSTTGIYFTFMVNEITFLNLNYHASGINSIVVGPVNKLNLMLKDDNIIELSPLEIESAKFDSLNNTDISVFYLISTEDINKIRTVGMKKIRFSTTEYYYDFDITKEKWVIKLNQNIDCFLNEIKK